MLLRRLTFLACLASWPLAAGTIYPQQVTVTLNPGDSLVFLFSEAGYAANAARFGASAAPERLSFSFATAELPGAFDFSARLLAYDNSAEIPFANEAVTPGYFSGTGYKGEVSVASGSASLSPADSAAIFSGPAAVLLLENTGAAVTLGLPPYSLAQDMLITLSGRMGSGGILSVGGTVTSVSLDRAPDDSFSPAAISNPEAPEPQSWLLFAAGAGALLLLGRRRR